MHAQTLVGMAQKKYNDAQTRMQDAQLRLMGMLGNQPSLPPDIDPAEFAQFQSSRIPPTP
jgi:outer membrane protein TolC